MNYDDLVQQMISIGGKSGFDAAIKFIDNYVNENPNNFEGYLVRSEIFTETGNLQNALDDSEKAITINPTEAIDYNNRGCIYIKSGNDINKALDDFNKAIELNPSYNSAYTNRANVYLKKRELQKAISDCTKAIELSSTDMEPYSNRGLAYYNRGVDNNNMEDLRKAFEDYNKVLELDPENAEAFAKRGLLNAQFGNTQEAISDYEEFLRLDPNNKNAKLVRDELAQLKSGKTLSSAESYEVITGKKERKILLVLSAIGFILGIIIGANDRNILIWMWAGIGIGGALSFLPEIPGIFMSGYRKEGFTEAIKTTIGGGLIWLVIFMIAGPIGLLVRILKINKKIKEYQ
jgi:tetratricopeptide (TPR) repeat protein